MMRFGLLARKRHRKLLERKRLARHKARVGPVVYAKDREAHRLALKKHQNHGMLQSCPENSLLFESSPPTESIPPKSSPPSLKNRLKRLNPFNSTTKPNDSL